MPLLLCVDCGGSKTAATLADPDGTVRAHGFGGPSNFAYLSLDAFISAVKKAIIATLENYAALAGDVPTTLPPTTDLFVAAWFGVSGVDSPAAVEAITPALSRLLNIPTGPRLKVTNDTHLLAAPIRMYDDISHGVAVISGTGAIAASFKDDGQDFQEFGRVGGWGWILGDEGGGFSVGREAIRQMLAETDKASVGGNPPPESILTSRILEYFGINNVMEVLTVVHLPDPIPSNPVSPNAPLYTRMVREKRLSSLSPLVFDAAFKDSDWLALRVLRTCARDLAVQIAILLAKEGDDSPRAVKASEAVISFGGSLVAVQAYRDLVLEELKERGHVFKYVDYLSTPQAMGAVGLSVAFKGGIA
ncbi:hypothetical protein AMATHDRAFT_57437 [Amanita thiersii Skay4041]|uniref:N-acetyl-D-glucosamine kinase n=1 Tax=Amanita thiersii Skay4041 TaxID=703135 RepID=A0A2A9NV01_9AGAR|nr:hypothetical protein AMATHDRAFT_57437 [Amanita thiersii Skay4041]